GLSLPRAYYATKTATVPENAKTGPRASRDSLPVAQCLSLEDFRMTSAPKPVGSPLHSADAPFPDKAKKKPWPPRRLIATHANSEIAPTPSQHRTSHFLTATRNTVPQPGSSTPHRSRVTLHEVRITSTESRPVPRYNISMPIKLIAMDLDGTLLDSRAHISEENAGTIAEAQSRGI